MTKAAIAPRTRATFQYTRVICHFIERPLSELVRLLSSLCLRVLFAPLRALRPDLRPAVPAVRGDLQPSLYNKSARSRKRESILCSKRLFPLCNGPNSRFRSRYKIG